MKSNRRTQSQKPARSGAARDAYRQQLRAAGTPRPSGTDYKRKPKHGGWSK